jgi:hypothetical protein
MIVRVRVLQCMENKAYALVSPGMSLVHVLHGTQKVCPWPKIPPVFQIM